MEEESYAWLELWELVFSGMDAIVICGLKKQGMASIIS